MERHKDIFDNPGIKAALEPTPSMINGQRYAATSGVVHDGEYVKIFWKTNDQFTTAG